MNKIIMQKVFKSYQHCCNVIIVRMLWWFWHAVKLYYPYRKIVRRTGCETTDGIHCQRNVVYIQPNWTPRIDGHVWKYIVIGLSTLTDWYHRTRKFCMWQQYSGSGGQSCKRAFKATECQCCIQWLKCRIRRVECWLRVRVGPRLGLRVIVDHVLL